MAACHAVTAQKDRPFVVPGSKKEIKNRVGDGNHLLKLAAELLSQRRLVDAVRCIQFDARLALAEMQSY